MNSWTHSQLLRIDSSGLGSTSAGIEPLDKDIGDGKKIENENETHEDLRQFQNISTAEVRTKIREGRSSYIWDFSDSNAWFISGLYHNNPSLRRKQLETVVNYPLSKEPSDFSFDYKAFHRRYQSFDPSTDLFHCPTTGINLIEPEITEVVRKVIDLMTDMLKSVEIIFHAYRAVAKFMTFPTPSVPSDNYIFGQVRGWIWLIYKGIYYLTPKKEDIQENIKVLQEDLSKLSKEIRECILHCEKFNDNLKKFQKDVDREVKFLKSKGGIWGMKMKKYTTHVEQLAGRSDILLDTGEDRYIGSDWIFEPEPSAEEKALDFFHFQWIRMDKDTEFEIRSDYSNRWLTFSKFEGHLQMEMLRQIILHLTAMVTEAKEFNNFHLHLTFEKEDFHCLKITLHQITKKKDNARTSTLLANMIAEFFQEFSNLAEISSRFQNQMVHLSELIATVYDTVKRWSGEFRIPALDNVYEGKIEKSGCCGRRNKNAGEFLEIYGEPMEAVLLRTPISKTVINKYFTGKNLKTNYILPNAVDKFGLSRGYRSSIFDKGLGRDPPLKPFRILKSKRRAKDLSFDVLKFHQHIKLCIRKEDGELELEEYVLVFDQIAKFVIPIFGWATTDLNNKLEIIEKLIYGTNAPSYETLELMASFESKEMKVKIGSKTFIKLHRIFVFMSAAIEKLIALQENETTYYAFKNTYNSYLANYHSWITQKAAAFSFYYLPTKRDLYDKYEDTLKIQEIDEVLTKVLEISKNIITHCENLFSRSNLLENT